MLLREVMWEIFLTTGHIGAYLAYRSCKECDSFASQPFLKEAIHTNRVEVV